MPWKEIYNTVHASDNKISIKSQIYTMQYAIQTCRNIINLDFYSQLSVCHGSASAFLIANYKNAPSSKKAQRFAIFLKTLNHLCFAWSNPFSHTWSKLFPSFLNCIINKLIHIHLGRLIMAIMWLLIINIYFFN